MEHYRVLEMIGEGSFGRVYKGRRKFSGQVVALKFIPKVGRSEKELRSLKKEIEIMRGLKHPNIVLLLDSFETQTKVVVVTEYAEGELFQILEDDGCLPESQVREIACQLVSALYYLHSHRILHRDMKPQNILLGKGGVVKLCDFGFARVMSVSTLVLTSIKGTPLYMSPELVEEKPYDHTADLWSLGCILYELHTGAPPFFTNSIFHLVKLIVKDPVKWPENMSQDCMSFLKGLLIKDPQNRLTWPGLLRHPFVAHGVIVLPDEELCSPLTITPSPDVQAMKQQQVAEKSSVRNGQGKLLRKARDLHDKTSKKNQDQSKSRKALPNTKLRTKTSQTRDAPTSSHSLGSTFIVCRNSDHLPTNQHQANDIGVARGSSAQCKGPISRDYEREFPSVAVGPRREMFQGCSRPGHTGLASVRMNSDEHDVNSDEEWQQLAEVTDHMSVPMDPHIHQKLKNKLLRYREQILNGKLERFSTILQPLKVLTTIILTSDPANARRICGEIDGLHILFSLIEVMLWTPELMKKPWSERVLAELTAVLLSIWESQPDWKMEEKRAEDLCQLLTLLLLDSDPNVLAAQAAALLSLFVCHNVCVNIHMDRLAHLLTDLLTEQEKPHYPLPPGWGRCDGVLALILYFLYESDSSALCDFLNSEVWCHLWTKVATNIESTAANRDFLSVDGLCVFLSIALFAFSNEPQECLSLFFDDNKKLIHILTHLLATNSSAPLKRGLLWGGFDMNSLSVMSCQLLCFPFAAELPQEKMEAILQTYQSLNIVESLVQLIQLQSPAVLELPLSLLRRLCLSSPKYALPSFITAAQDCGFLPQSASLDQSLNNLNQSVNAAEHTRCNDTEHKKKFEMNMINGHRSTITTDIIRRSINKSRDTRDPTNLQYQLPKNKSGKVRERGFYSKIKQDLNLFSKEHLQDSIEQQSDAGEELLDCLEFHKGFAVHQRQITAWHKSNLSMVVDSLELPMHCIDHGTVIKGCPKSSEVKSQCHQPEFRTASSLLSMLLQTESVVGCAVQLLSLLCHICTAGSAFSAIPIDPVMLRAALCHHDDGVRAAGCNLLTCLQPDMGQASPRSNVGPNWAIEPAVFKDLLRCLSDSAPSVRRSACKAAVKWLGFIRNTKVTAKLTQHLQGTECSKRTLSAPAVTGKDRVRVKVEGITQQIKEHSSLSLGFIDTSIAVGEWLKIAMEAASPAVSLLSDSDAVIRQQGCIILESMAAITGGERALRSVDASHKLLRLANADSHHAVRQQALVALCAFSQQDTFQQALKSIGAEVKRLHVSQSSALQSSHRQIGQAERKHNVDSTPG